MKSSAIHAFLTEKEHKLKYLDFFFPDRTNKFNSSFDSGIPIKAVSDNLVIHLGIC